MMYAGGGYDAAGASQFNGGGFMPSQGAAAGSAQKGGKDWSAVPKGVRSLTVKQLHTALAAGSPPSLDGAEVANVTLVGKLLSVDEAAATVALRLHDGTGAVTVKHYAADAAAAGGEAEAARRAEWRVGAYVRVHGHVNQMDGAGASVNAFSVRPLEDHNEVTYHALQCVFQALHLSKGGAAAGGGGAGGAAPAPPLAAAGGYAAAPPAPAGGAGGSPIQREVLSVFQAQGGASDTGLTVDDVVRALGGRLSPQQVLAAVSALTDDGQLYTTIDEQHWKACG